MRIVTAEEMRRIDKFAIEKIGIPGSVLMESAGRSVFAGIVRREGTVAGKRFGILCGTGNNGGDGFVIARYLTLHGAQVDVWLVGEGRPKQGDALTNLKILEKTGIHPVPIRTAADVKKHAEQLRGWSALVDALFGTGLTRVLRGVHAATIDAANHFPGSVYAVDIPSGLHSDTGEVMGKAVKATVTVTFGFKKRGFHLGEGPLLCGEVVVADISLDDRWAEQTGATPLFETDPDQIQHWFPKRRPDSHKGSFGHVLVLAGSPQKSGASVLTSKAALRSGAGLVTLAVPESAHSIVKSQLVEVMTEPLPDDGSGGLGPKALSDLLRICEGKEVLVAGPGLLPTNSLKSLLEKLIQAIKIPIVLDADGLNVFGKNIGRLSLALKRMVLTPHPGEMSRLTGKTIKEIQANRIESARRFSDRTGAVLVLKGARSVVACPDGRTFINPTGNPGMATAGMGDVLSGIVGSFVAQGLSLDRAAIAGVFHHGWAGDRVARKNGSRGLLASDLIDELPHLSI
ncbi:MAG: NAD(P)H-hydrate dehydratase [Pseudomonadota bacterium]